MLVGFKHLIQMVFVLGTDHEYVSPAEIERRRTDRQERCVIRKGKKPRAPRHSLTDSMETTAEQLWSAKTRGVLDFEPIEPIRDAMPVGGVGIIAGPAGGGGSFESYIKNPKVVKRLEAEGFEQAGRGAPHRWFLVIKPGVVTPANKALARSLTPEQRAKIEANRIAALKRKSATVN